MSPPPLIRPMVALGVFLCNGGEVRYWLVKWFLWFLWLWWRRILPPMALFLLGEPDAGEPRPDGLLQPQAIHVVVGG